MNRTIESRNAVARMKKYFKTLEVIILLLPLASFAQTGGDAVIYPDTKLGNPITDFFIDLKASASTIGDATKAHQFFVDQNANGVRVPIYGNQANPYHVGPGQIDTAGYAAIKAAIIRAKTARGNQDFTIFASKKLDGQNSFPSWTKDSNGVIPSQYAILLADYLVYMQSVGLPVDYLGIDNEAYYNEGNITPQKFKDIVDLLKGYAISRNFKMPKIVGYEDYGPDKNNWMQILSENNWLSRMDIYGTHYYPQYRPKGKLLSDLTYANHLTFWSTEPHWDNTKAGTNDLSLAEQAMCALWDQIDLGMSGFMWWVYGGANKVRENLMYATSIPIKDAQKIDMDDIDGRDISTLGKLQTRAFRKGDKITVYAINLSANAFNDYGFNLQTEEAINGNVDYTQWTDTSPSNGNSGTATLSNNHKFTLTLPSRSITVFSFKLGITTSINPKKTVENKLCAYPNPVSTILHLAGISESSEINIYSVSGKLMIKSKGESVDVSGLLSGSYVLSVPKIGNVNFIKL